MKSNKVIIIIVAIIVIAAGVLIALKYTFRGHKETEKKKADIEITATQLLSEFMENEPAANEKFGGKIVEVTGVVGEIEDDESGLKVYLRDEDAFEGVSCAMSEGIAAGDIKEGENIIIRGECDGMLLDVILKRCVIIKE